MYSVSGKLAQGWKEFSNKLLNPQEAIQTPCGYLLLPSDENNPAPLMRIAKDDNLTPATRKLERLAESVNAMKSFSRR